MEHSNSKLVKKKIQKATKVTTNTVKRVRMNGTKRTVNSKTVDLPPDEVMGDTSSISPVKNADNHSSIQEELDVSWAKLFAETRAAYIVIVPDIFGSNGAKRGDCHEFWIKVGDGANPYDRFSKNYPNRNPDCCAALIFLNYEKRQAPGTVIEDKALGQLPMARDGQSEWRRLYLTSDNHLGIKNSLADMMAKFHIIRYGEELKASTQRWINSPGPGPISYTLEEAIAIIESGVQQHASKGPDASAGTSTAVPAVGVIVIPNLGSIGDTVGGFEIDSDLHTLQEKRTVFWVCHEYSFSSSKTPAYKYYTHSPSFSDNAFVYSDARKGPGNHFTKGNKKANKLTESLCTKLKEIQTGPENDKAHIIPPSKPDGWIQIRLGPDSNSSIVLDWLRLYVTNFGVNKGAHPSSPSYSEFN